MLETYGRPLRRLCKVYLRDAAEQEDLFQEIAFAIWTALPNFRRDSTERTWAYRIAHNVALSYSAKRRRQQCSELPMETLPCDPAIEGQVQRNELLDAVHQLKPIDRHLVVLYLEGLTAREIAEVTGLTVDSIGVRLSRMKHRLAVMLHGKENNK